MESHRFITISQSWKKDKIDCMSDMRFLLGITEHTGISNQSDSANNNTYFGQVIL